MFKIVEYVNDTERNTWDAEDKQSAESLAIGLANVQRKFEALRGNILFLCCVAEYPLNRWECVPFQVKLVTHDGRIVREYVTLSDN